MKYDVVGQAQRDYAILDKLPDNMDAMREAAERLVAASDLSAETKAFLHRKRKNTLPG